MTYYGEEPARFSSLQIVLNKRKFLYKSTRVGFIKKRMAFNLEDLLKYRLNVEAFFSHLPVGDRIIKTHLSDR